MFKIASTLASRVRLANNSFPLVGNTWSWSRNCAVNVVDLKEVSLQKYIRETELMDKFVSSAIESFVQDVPNPSCDMIEEGLWFESEGTRYRPVLFRVLFDECRKAMDAGVRLSNLQRVLLYRPSELIGLLKSKARVFCGSRDIMQVATTAANGDRKIGSLIVKAIDRVGERGFFVVSIDLVHFWVHFWKWRKSTCELDFGSGMKTNWDFASPYFITHQAERKCVLENPLILIYGGKLLNDDVIQRAIRLGKPLLVIAEDVERKVLGSIMLDRFFHGSKLCIVKPSAFTKNLEEIMQDLAIFTGSEVVTREFDMNLLPKVLGSCKQVTVSNREMLILGRSKDIEEKGKQLKCSVDAGCPSEEMRERISKFSGEAAIFKVGGASNAEADKMYNRVTNALNASKDAMNGVLPSGGVALLHASKALDDWLTGNPYDDIGVRILQRVMKMPVYTIATTAGFDGAAVVEKLLKQDNPNLGFDPTTGEYVDFMKSGIIDPMELITRELSIAKSNCLNLLSLERHFSYVNPMED